MVGTPGEMLSRRCVALLKTALKPDVWPQQCDLKLNWFDKVFASVESGSPNYGNICTALELLTFLLGVMKKEQILASCKPLQRGIAACITCSNSKVQHMACLRRCEDKLTDTPLTMTLHEVTASAVYCKEAEGTTVMWPRHWYPPSDKLF
jgi:hypothetical protein